MRTWLSGFVLVIASAALYGRGLSRPPVAAAEREVVAASVAAVAPTTPFIRVNDGQWLGPTLRNVLAMAMRIGPSTRPAARLVAVAFGVADVLLVYLIGLQLFNRLAIAWGSALILLLTPAHAVFSRTAPPEGIWPLPFVLAWVLSLRSLAVDATTRSRWVLAAGVGSLMLAGYVQPSAVVMIPLFGAVTIAIIHSRGDWTVRDLVPALVTAVVLSPAIVWWSWRPGPDGVSFARWLIEFADVRSGQIASADLNRFWGFFLPSHLFFDPGNRGFCGLFLTAAAVPIIAGACALFPNDQHHPAFLRAVIVAGCVSGPLTAALCGPLLMDARAISALPFAALIAGSGSAVMWRQSTPGRAVLAAAVIAMVIQGWHCI